MGNRRNTSERCVIFVQNFTDLTIRSLEAGTHFDPKQPGFAIRVGKNRKTWIAVKGPRNKRVQVILGHYPAVSLQDARKKALVELGSPNDPRVSLAFPAALKIFLDQPRWKFHSKRVLESSLRHFDWKRPLDKITHEDVASALDAIEGVSARNHALKDIRTFFNWCVPRYLATSPASGLKMLPTASRSRVLTDDELKRVWLAAGDADYPFGTIVRLLILTGQRKSEIGLLTWDQIKKGRIRFSETKNSLDHEIPVTANVAQLIVQTGTREGFVFRSAKVGKERYAGYAFHLKQLQKASDTTDWTLHDLRRTFATGLASLGVPIHVTEKLLNHVSGTLSGVAGIYNRFDYWDDQVAALRAWEEKVLSFARAG